MKTLLTICLVGVVVLAYTAPVKETRQIPASYVYTWGDLGCED